MRAQSLHPLVLFLLLSSTSIGNAQVNLITNGSFESGTSPGGGNLIVSAGQTDITGWTVASGNVDYIEEPYWQASDGTRSLDLNGSSPAIISQSFPTVVGQGYHVRFALAGNTDDPSLKTLRVIAAATSQDFSFDSTGHSRGNMGWVEETATFVATAGTTTLILESLTPSARGPAVDDVRVVPYVCGDGNLDPADECDDGNTANGDGCNANCRIEPCWACGGEPSVCEPAQTTMAVDSTGDVGHYASIAIGSDGLPVISHYDDGNDDLRVTHCDDPQCLTQTTTVVADGFEDSANAGAGSGDAGAHSQIAISGDANPIISFQQDGIMLRTVHCNEPDCTTSPRLVQETDHPGGSGTGYENSIAVLPDGHPLIAWGRPSTATAGLWVSRCDNFACNGADAQRIDTDSNDRATAMAIGGDGLPLVVFRNGPDNLRIAHCSTPSCSGVDSVQTLDTATGVGNAIAIGADGFGIISYQDFTAPTALRVVHCTNATCSTFDPPVTIDGSNTVGPYTSIAIGADGRPLIAYYDDSVGDLKLAGCNNTTCSNGAVIRTLDGATANVGFGLDIATGPDGQAYVAYRDDTNETLKLAICGPLCGDGNKTPDEDCDDGDLDNGDGCSASCTVETCWDCSGDPSVCAPESSGSSCPDDGLFCNGTESCNGAGACVGNGDPCSGGDCNTTCNEGSDDCFDPNGTPCSDEPNPCTVDTCDGAGTCAHTAGNGGALCRPDAGACDVAELCDGSNAACPADGFESSGTPCGNPNDDACTDPDTCGSAGSCQGNHASGGTPCPDDGQVCTIDQCDGGGSCQHPAGNPGTECRPDAGQCDVAEQCDGSNSTCPADGFEPNGSGCTDGNACTQTDQCIGGSCTGSNPLVCNDSNPCTVDSCAAGSGCVADEAPRTGCRGADKSILSISNRSDDDTLDKFLWLWNLGEATSQAEFGDPTTSASYTLCVYQSGNGLLWRADVPPSMTRWKPLGEKGWKYKDPDGTAYGLQKMQMKASTEARARVLVKGKGVGLPDPALGNLVTPVTAQLHSSDTGLCWDATYSAPKKNTSTQFKAKAP